MIVENASEATPEAGRLFDGCGIDLTEPELRLDKVLETKRAGVAVDVLRVPVQPP